MTDFLRVNEMLALYEDQIDRYGGVHGIRDLGLLEAALFRPSTGHYADLIEQAAALWESLARSRPFVDGNRRAAFAAAYTFLAMNGTCVTASAQQAHVFICGLNQTNQISLEKLATWLREYVVLELV